MRTSVVATSIGADCTGPDPNHDVVQNDSEINDCHDIHNFTNHNASDNHTNNYDDHENGIHDRGTEDRADDGLRKQETISDEVQFEELLSSSELIFFDSDSSLSELHHRSTFVHEEMHSPSVQQPPMSSWQLRSNTSTEVPARSLHQQGEPEGSSATQLTSTSSQHNAELPPQHLTEQRAPSLAELVPLLCAIVLNVLFFMSASHTSHPTSSSDVTSRSVVARKSQRAHEPSVSRQKLDAENA